MNYKNACDVILIFVRDRKQLPDKTCKTGSIQSLCWIIKFFPSSKFVDPQKQQTKCEDGVQSPASGQARAHKSVTLPAVNGNIIMW